MSLVLTDPYGVQIRIGDDVFFAGTDAQRKPTLNKGTIERINTPARKVLIRRTARSGNAVADSFVRLIWVEITKIGIILP